MKKGCLSLTAVIPRGSAGTLEILWPDNLLWPRDCVLVVRQPFTVREVVGTTIRVLRPVAEAVAVTQRPQDGHGAGIVPAGAALPGRVPGPAVVPWNVPVGRGPGWGALRQADEEGKKEKGRREPHR